MPRVQIRPILTTAALVVAVCCGYVPAASAQYFAEPAELPIGENYRVELLGGVWSTLPDITMSSDEFGIAGTAIDFVNDLGIGAQALGEFRLRLRPGRRHRFRIDYIPGSYSAQGTPDRRLVFRGIAFDAGEPVASTMVWRTVRLGYQYDVVQRSRGYAGIIFEARYTELEAVLENAAGREFVRARGPIPSLGAMARFYPLPILAISTEVSFFHLPKDVVEGYAGQHLDLDVYGTINLTRQLGAQFGYRSLELNLSTTEEEADLRSTGIYFGILLRL